MNFVAINNLSLSLNLSVKVCLWVIIVVKFCNANSDIVATKPAKVRTRYGNYLPDYNFTESYEDTLNQDNCESVQLKLFRQRKSLKDSVTFAVQ